MASKKSTKGKKKLKGKKISRTTTLKTFKFNM